VKLPAISRANEFVAVGASKLISKILAVINFNAYGGMARIAILVHANETCMHNDSGR
jgi:hypothetical protein